uniref:Uncharacterized protein n=1 Tax=viral metagenome TaxID=1070528 RepID=A0A6M3M7Y3_9ZZZZ
MYIFECVLFYIMKGTKRIIVDINTNLHHEFKKTCAANDDSISSVIKTAISRYITEHKKNIIY